MQYPALKKSYTMLALIYTAGLSGAINQFKVPPMMQSLMASFDISLGASGLLMSVFALVGLVLAIPTGLLLRKSGNKNTGLLALGLILAGSLTAVFSRSFSLMLISRVMEGAGMCMFSIAAPAAIAAWFPPAKRGVATGIWITWVPVGSMIMYIVAPLLGIQGNWQPVWWFAALYSLLAFILFLVFFKMPPNWNPSSRSIDKPLSKTALKNICLVAAVFMLFNILTISIKSYLPSFLEIFRGYSLFKAAGIVNIMIFVSVFTGPLTGIVSDKTGSRKIPLLTGCLIALTAVCLPFRLEGWPIVAAMLMLGISCGNIATSAFTSATEMGGPSSKANTGVSVVAFGQYLGMSAGPLMFSLTAEKLGWFTAGGFLIPVALAACLCALAVKIK